MLLLLIVYAGGSLIIASIIWHPVRKALHTTPAQYGLAYTGVQFRSEGDNLLLKGWFIDSPGTDTVLIMHGSNSVRDNYINMEMARILVQHNYDVLLFDFRGHGESEGSIGALGAIETRDVAGALAYLKGRGVGRVGALAYSMGAATALLTAPTHPEMATLVADSSFSKLSTVLESERTKDHIPALLDPGILLASKALYGMDPSQNQPGEAIARLKSRPILLIHSKVDDLIPVSEAYELQKAGAGNPNLELWVTPGVGHVTSFATNREEYAGRVVGFFDKHLRGAR